MSDANPIKILKTLDSFLTEPIELVVYGKSAIYLMFPEDEKIGVTNDLDLIIPEVHISIFDKRLDFWEAVEKTNKELEHLGLYLKSKTRLLILRTLAYLHQIHWI